MKYFVLLTCISISVKITTARPDLSLGYRYNQGHSSGGGSFLNAPAPFGLTAPESSYYNTVPPTGHGSYSGQYRGTGGTGYIGQPAVYHAPIVNKNFYRYSAPIEHDEENVVRYIDVGRPQKNYRIVFIDAPSATSSKAKIIANVAPVEEKTAIYVLSKKSNHLDIDTEVVTAAPVKHKPEVYFVKYNTAEEAAHAQQTIQAQYDTLGGTSDVSNEGTVPVITSFVGSSRSGAPHATAHSDSNTQQIYLPAHRK